MQIDSLDIPEEARRTLLLNGITKLNPPQAQAVDAGLLEGQNVVVASPTASGKTLIGELAFLKTILEKKRKAVYIVPLKALASEKYDDFKKYESLGLRVAISVGDKDTADTWLQNYDLVIVTSEKLDSLLRHEPPWIHEIGLVIADEVHLLNDESRGPTLEVVLTRLRELNPQILALSATIANAEELASWLNAKLVRSDYRPVTLYQGVYSSDAVRFEEASRDFEVDGDEQAEIIILGQTVKKGKQALVFASSRRNAESIAEKSRDTIKALLKDDERVKLAELSKAILAVPSKATRQCEKLAACVTSGVAFHHAGLAGGQRKLIEDAFRQNLIKAVAATPTMAMGLNLPAYRVLIRDVRRYHPEYGSTFIPVLEYQQMCLSSNERIILEDGQAIKISDIVNKKIRSNVLSYNEERGRIEPRRIIGYFSRGARTLLTIHTECTAFSITPEHPILTLDEGRLMWKIASELKKGDKLLWASEYEYTDTVPYFYQLLPMKRLFLTGHGSIVEDYKRKSNLTDKQISQRLKVNHKTIYHYKQNRKAIPLQIALQIFSELGYSEDRTAKSIKYVKTAYGNEVELPRKLTKDFLWLAGLVATDGNLNKSKDKRTGGTYTKIRLFNKNRSIVDKAETILRALGVGCRITEKDALYTLEAGNTLLADLLNSRFLIPFGKKASKTSIPPLLLTLPRDYIGAYLAGVFDGDGSYTETRSKRGSLNRRILFSTSSREFAIGLRRLLYRLGAKAKIGRHHPKRTFLKGKIANFVIPNYTVYVLDVASINNLSGHMRPIKHILPRLKYSNYHNIDRHHTQKGAYVTIKNIEVVRERVKVYNIRVEGNENYLHESNIIMHNCGRAGRPRFEKEGESILIAKTSAEAKDLVERYVNGEPEEITSKLSVEPVLRMHVLSLIATHVSSEEALRGFFERTFFVHQFKDFDKIRGKIGNVLRRLQEQKFIKYDGETIEATQVGKRVAQLYLDPETAYRIINKLGSCREMFHYLLLVSDTREMYPFNLKAREDEKLVAEIEKRGIETPSPWEVEYDEFLQAFKTALVLEAWTEEAGEDVVYKRFGAAPGELRTRVETTDWLLYAAQELALLLAKASQMKDLRKARVRVKYGVKEELVPLVQLRGIGRVRARTLYGAGYTSLAKLKKVPEAELARLIGQKTAKDVLKQFHRPEDLEEKQATLRPESVE